jgi:hypothetical protein
MTRTGLTLLSFFVTLAVTQRVLEPAYPLFLVVFALLIGVALARAGLLPIRLRHPTLAIVASAWAAVTVAVTVGGRPELRDVVRDGGALLAFFVGLYAVPAVAGKDREERLLSGLSDLGVAVAVATLFAAAAAYAAGVGAYDWRGVYVPYAHNWLPLLLVATVALGDQDPGRRIGGRVSLQVLAILSSLSRTDVLMITLFGLWLLIRRGKRWLSQPASRLRLALACAGMLVLMPAMLGLGVVQERVQVGVSDDDLSIGWRLMENLAFLTTMDQAGLLHWWFGLGLGARVELPAGIVDFNDNTSIPHLHNSFLTIVLKFGIGGLALILSAAALLLWRAARRATPSRYPLRMTGSWMLLFIAGKAVTLHGLSEWSHLVFAGLACALLAASCKHQPSGHRSE